MLGGSAETYWGGGPPAAALQSAVQRYWTRFARTGDPNGDDDPEWPVYAVDDDQYLRLVDPPESDNGLARATCDFWRDYFLQGGGIVVY